MDKSVESKGQCIGNPFINHVSASETVICNKRSMLIDQLTKTMSRKMNNGNSKLSKYNADVNNN